MRLKASTAAKRPCCTFAFCESKLATDTLGMPPITGMAGSFFAAVIVQSGIAGSLFPICVLKGIAFFTSAYLTFSSITLPLCRFLKLCISKVSYARSICFTSSSDVLLVDSLFLARTISSKEEFSLTPSSFIALSALIIEDDPGSPIDARTVTLVLRDTSLALLFAFVVNTPVPTRASRGRNMALVLQRSRHCPEATCNPTQAMLAMGGTC
mmetsp:Transcript_10301/g.17741  ORF Transcript_10301/g.17741 Transcript_10301/m.17741 type:complete len:211 (-) Transcript_10301:331-963(-)